MSYLAGLTAGTLLAEQLRKSAAVGERFKLVHGIAHRRRYYHPRIKTDSGYAEKLENHLKSFAEITGVTVNRTTGSLVITYSCSEDQIDLLTGRCFASSRAGGVKKTAVLKRGIKDLVGLLDVGVYKKTGGWLDLSSSLAALFLSMGIYKTLKLKQWPNGAQMLWWSYNLLKK